MKKSIILIFICLMAYLSPVNAQTHHHEEGEPCGIKEQTDKLIKEIPGFKEHMEKAQAQLEKETEKFIKEKRYEEKVTYTIPVVFHIIHQNGAENLPLSTIQAGINIMNEDYSGAYTEANLSKVFSQFQGIRAGNIGIEFRLAQIDPSGNPTDGVTRTYNPTWSSNMFSNEYSYKTQLQWDRSKYLNIYVGLSCNSSNTSGMAYYPSSVTGTYAYLDGIIMASWAVSRNYGYSVLSHEAGHWLNLIHTWGDGDCSVDDEVSDTPTGSTYHQVNPLTTVTDCGYLQNIENYMDYGYCEMMFTQGQKARILAALTSSVSSRNNLWSAANLAATLGDPTQPRITISSASFNEGTANDGGVTSTATLNIANDAFKVSSGTFTQGTHYTVSGVPAGLSLVITANSSTQATLSFTGKATSHANANDVSNVKVTFLNAAVTSNNIAAHVSSSLTLSIDFKDPYKIVYSNITDIVCNATTSWTYFSLGVGDAEYGSWYYSSSMLKLETYGKAAVCASGTRNMSPLAANITIGSSSTWGLPGAYPDQLDFGSNWLGQTAYVGIKFSIDGINANYGWIRVNFASNGASYTILDWAYNEQPNAPILAGATVSQTDTQAPTVLTGLTAGTTSQTSVALSWTASTDNVAVTGYDIYRGTTLAGSSTTNSYTATGLTCNTSYSFTVRAKDAAGNVSAASSALSKTTSACSTDTQAPTVPANLAASNITSNSVQLNWTASTDNVGVVGYDIYRSSTLIGTSTTNNFSVTGLTANTAYSFTVRAKDAAGNVSAASNAASATTLPISIDYCLSMGNSAAYEWIASVKVGSFTKTSNGNDYSDFTSPAIDMVTGANSITLTPGFSSSSYSEYWVVWIDFNNNKVFTDAGEQVFSGSSSSAISGTINANLTGTFRMRVSMKYGSAPTSCETFAEGEVEDYTVNIMGDADITPPTAPANLKAGTVTTSSVALSWDASVDNVGVVGYEIYRGTTLVATSTTVNYVVTGLSANTTYSFTVKAKDAMGNISNPSNTLSATTLNTVDIDAPSVPTNLAASNITTTSVQLNWTASTDNVGVTGYDVYRNSSLVTTITTNSFNVTGLSPATAYTFYVKAKDAAGNISTASSTVIATTLPDGGSVYCTSLGADNSREYIRIVSFGSFSNTSVASGYSDFTNMTINMAPGSVSYTLTPKFVSTSRTVYWRVWIDFNKNGSFNDSGEQLIAISSKSSRTGTITIPSSATGTTRMRVSMKYGGAQTSCEMFTYGEVEDYTVDFGGSTTDTQAPSVPTNLLATSITQTSFTLSWAASTDNVGVTGYDVYRGANLIGSPSTTSFNVLGLTANTSYSFTVRAKDAADNVSAASSVLIMTTLGDIITNYCASQGNDQTYEWIAGVQLGNLNKTSEKSTYSDFTSSVANLTLGSSVSLVVTPGFRPNEPYNEYWVIWIDYNKNGLFTDAGEQVYTGNGTTALSGSFTVPSGLSGTTRMRVSMNYGSAPSSCGSFASGEVEDYTVNFGAAGPNSPVAKAEELIISLFPNPSNGKFKLAIPSGVNENVIVNVYSMDGQLLFAKTNKLNGNSAEIPVSLNVAAGIYSVQVIIGDTVNSKQVIVK